jgi:hypothetical protein
MEAIACFRGVKRPFDGEDDGDSILIYVLEIPVSVEYNPDLICVASAVIVPTGIVATVQVRPNNPLQPDGAGVYGTITRIEFVPGEGSQPTLPRGFEDRYLQRLWWKMGHMFNMDEADLLSGERYAPRAVYFMDSDCVEYVKQDSFCIYDRVDGFLTLIFDKTQFNLIGFKLKGFKHVFDKHLRPLYKLHSMQFVDLVSAIEGVVSEMGDEVFADKDERRVRAYQAVLELAANDNVKLDGIFLEAA